MEFSGENPHWSLVDEEREHINLSRIFSFGKSEVDSEIISARTSCMSAASFPLWPICPETPWTRSPVRASLSPLLLYNCLASLHRSEGNIFSIAVTSDFIFAGSASSRIHAWKQPDCTEMGCIKATIGEIRAILAYGKMLFTTHGDYRIRVWDISSTENFRPKKTITLPRRRSFFSYLKKDNEKHRDSISCIAYNHKEKLLYTGSWDSTVKVWKISEKRSVDSFVAHEGHVNAIVLNQEDGCVFTCSSDGKVKIWRRVFRESSHILTMTLKFQPSPVNALSLSLSPDECILYSGSSDGLINFWEKERMSSRYNHGGFLQGHHFAVLCLATIKDLILSGSEDATIRIWRREDGNSFHSSLAVIDGHHGPVKCLSAALETEEIMTGLLVYSASLDQTFKVWRVRVHPAEKEKLKKSEANDQHSKITDCKLSPVLSPSWVEKKIQGSDF
ncbi:protein JINGUBANG-like [Olea europaea var. sylvestris]|uniref:protein JINGUBANG-like n=1 Tax=Olea europaea var. sylvestris TaxID=158386 RepID=UPI000C1D5ED9|nr:protein JINGUBANG-like [Olea europaea var. sylvestris]